MKPGSTLARPEPADPASIVRANSAAASLLRFEGLMKLSSDRLAHAIFVIVLLAIGGSNAVMLDLDGRGQISDDGIPFGDTVGKYFRLIAAAKVEDLAFELYQRLE